ncbi:cytochrome P450 [Cellulophaga sp. E16_2]|uniref:Linalool 8-monooxygenase n=1 Tax=Cellulophaga algicola (strain DSM 14237 / IC166 / ACAM 630) TaxID=688270 RepID=E6XF59_CELAD|nr:MULTISPECIES: cytochrome P450 [Cellulophaga]ADV50295.1 Linalool 8-monooxygenase [Cellulophaga algicola DSM 14237]MBO0592697.1 cytochrome P450 [Cellulophaga sp. E16_2]
MKESIFTDPFKKARQETGIGEMDDQNDPVAMILGHKEVRRAAHHWKSYSSGAVPGRIVIPSEVNIRSIRQIPFEVDPPQHGAYREVVEKWFKRPLEKKYEEELTLQIEALVTKVLDQDSFEVIHDFALVLQSQALTLLFNVSFEEAQTWISWGTHVFRSKDSALDGAKATVLYDYIDLKLAESSSNPGKDFYAVLLAAEVDGKKLTAEEAKGVLILTFAGGRDTVINAVTNSIAYFAEHPKSLEWLRKEPELLPTAIEELIRYFSPLTQMGRVAMQDTMVCQHAVKADSRISLCWASANRDETVFENADEVVLDRKANPHVAFGFGTHNCLGATHARQVMKVLLRTLIAKVKSIDIHEAKDNIEDLGDFKRKVGFDSLTVKFNKL